MNRLWPRLGSTGAKIMRRETMREKLALGLCNLPTIRTIRRGSIHCFRATKMKEIFLREVNFFFLLSYDATKDFVFSKNSKNLIKSIYCFCATKEIFLREVNFFLPSFFDGRCSKDFVFSKNSFESWFSSSILKVCNSMKSIYYFWSTRESSSWKWNFPFFLDFPRILLNDSLLWSSINCNSIKSKFIISTPRKNPFFSFWIQCFRARIFCQESFSRKWIFVLSLTDGVYWGRFNVF